VVAGAVVSATTVIAVTAVLVLLMFGGDFAAPPTPAYLMMNLAYTLGAATVGGWVAGTLAPVRPFLHGVALAALLALPSVVGGGGGGGGAVGVPAWYPATVGLLGAAGALLGSASVGRRARTSPSPSRRPVDR
jgi:hypothetical protein